MKLVITQQSVLYYRDRESNAHARRLSNREELARGVVRLADEKVEDGENAVGSNEMDPLTTAYLLSVYAVKPYSEAVAGPEVVIPVVPLSC